MVQYAAMALDAVKVNLASAGGPLAHHDLMSPYIWTDPDGCRILLRVVPNPLGPADPTGVVYCGKTDDGLTFELDDKPAIMPGPEFDDAGGCEDPSVVMALNNDLLVYYTGVDARREQGCLMVARGRDLSTLIKQRVLLRAPEGEGSSRKPPWRKAPTDASGCSMNMRPGSRSMACAKAWAHRASAWR